MIDPATLMPLVNPVITAVVVFLKSEKMKSITGNLMNALDEKISEATIEQGQKAFFLLQSHFKTHPDNKARQALNNLEQDPDDDDYQKKLEKETARVASHDEEFIKQLRILAGPGTNKDGGNSFTIVNEASNQGVQGQNFYGNITMGFNHGDKK